MTPDVGRFAPFAPAVLGRGRLPVPVTVSDLTLGAENPVAAAFRAVVAALAGRCTAVDVLDLATLAPVRRMFSLTPADLERFGRWVDELGTSWGLDAHQRDEWLEANVAEGTWAAGIDRLLLGAAVPAPPGDLAAAYPGGVQPFDDIAADDMRSAGRLAELVGRLRRARSLLAGRHRIDEWTERLTAVLGATCSVPPDEAWQLASVAGAIDALREQAMVGGGRHRRRPRRPRGRGRPRRCARDGARATAHTVGRRAAHRSGPAPQRAGARRVPARHRRRQHATGHPRRRRPAGPAPVRRRARPPGRAPPRPARRRHGGVRPRDHHVRRRRCRHQPAGSPERRPRRTARRRARHGRRRRHRRAPPSPRLRRAAVRGRRHRPVVRRCDARRRCGAPHRGRHAHVGQPVRCPAAVAGSGRGRSRATRHRVHAPGAGAAARSPRRARPRRLRSRRREHRPRPPAVARRRARP